MENTLHGLIMINAQKNVEAVAKRKQEPVQTLLPNMVEKIALVNLKKFDFVTHNLVQVRAIKNVFQSSRFSR